jgi:acyl transferase domain-containing protein/SAM-dependent methyltransferase/acyl carrier protein
MTLQGLAAEPISAVKRALIEIRQLRARLARAEATQTEPIAIVGMGLRFPGGARDAESFARLLWTGTDAIDNIPAERWSTDELYSDDPDAPGKMTTRFGAFLDQVDQFDADFFGISPREAASMDPQQRLILETGWEALENAGHAPATLAGSKTGVYFGICNSDYGRALLAQPDRIDTYVSTGNAYSIAAGRLSYFLGLHGPSIAVDTACSSSLVALHLACQGLRVGDCDLALAGGSNLILAPEMNIIFSKARMMAPDGRCKTFDMAADGYVRGEGCGMLVLRRLSDAVADGDHVLAVVRGSAVNQDGRSGGLTAPNGPAQEAVIRAALAAANVPPALIGYVEAHGTGTALGDPIEVGALGAVFGPGRDTQRKLAIGSVKTNIGHLEAAGGVAGVIKVILGMQRGEIPPHLHLQAGNPHIDWAALPITVPVETTPWLPIDGRRLAGVSSFGFSGCNAHIVLEEAPARVRPTSPESDRPLHVLALSARDRTSLAELVRRYDTALSEDLAVADACYTANVGRSHFAERLAVVGADSAGLRRRLAAFARDEDTTTVATRSRDRAVCPQVAFLFTGQGCQYAGMGLQLYETSPAFRRALDACADGLAPYLRPGLLDLLRASKETTPINRTEYAQPAIFAVEYALATLWRSWGIEPVAVLGHSLGEYSAACVAGVLPLQDALRLVAERGRLTQALAEDGAMAAVFGTEAEVAAEITRAEGAVTIAACNGPAHFVLSCKRTAIESVVTRMQEAGLRARELRISFAAHSCLVEPMLSAYRAVLESVGFEPGRIPLISNVTGRVAGPEVEGAEYWLTHMRAPVRFHAAINTLAGQGISHCIEIGPHPVLLGMAAECLPGKPLTWLASLRRDTPAWCDLLESLQRLYVDGADIDWVDFDRDYTRHRVALPTYPFRRRRHWMDAVGSTPAAAAPANAADPWSLLETAVSRQARQGPLDLNAASYPAKWDCLARLTAAHAIRTLRECKTFIRPGEAHTLDQVLAVAGIATTYRHLVRRWLDSLVTHGVLRAGDGTYIADSPLSDPGLAALWAEAEGLFADNRPLLTYVQHCGALVGRVLRGGESPLETLFPRGSFELAETLYQRSATMQYVNSLAAAAVAAFSETVPGGRPVRILEVGAGTGGTTQSLLPVLPADRTNYMFTDVSDFFLDHARKKFSRHTFLTCGLFDMDQDTADQGHPLASVDVIISANALHTSVNLPAALRRLRTLLAPGGVLILIESTTHFAWFDMTTGLIDGWQHFDDDLRHDQPLLSAEAWLAALSDAGFETARSWPEPGSLASHLGQHVLVARVTAVSDSEVVPSIAFASYPNDASALPRAEAAAATTVRARILGAFPTERLELLRDFVRAQVVGVLRRDADDAPGRNDRLTDLGLDSLMAVQLRNQLGKRLGLQKDLPATLMFDYPTIERLALYLLEQLTPPEPTEASCPPEPDMDEPMPVGGAAIAGMTDAEIEALLAKRLDQV